MRVEDFVIEDIISFESLFECTSDSAVWSWKGTLSLIVESIEVHPDTHDEYAVRISKIPRTLCISDSQMLFETRWLTPDPCGSAEFREAVDCRVLMTDREGCSLLFELFGKRGRLEDRIGWLIFPLGRLEREVNRLRFNSIKRDKLDSVPELLLKGNIPVIRSKSSVTFSVVKKPPDSKKVIENPDSVDPTHYRPTYPIPRNCRLPLKEMLHINPPIRSGTCRAVKFNPSTSLIALQCDSAIYVFDLESHEMSACFDKADIMSFAWYPIELRIAIASSDGSLQCWNLETGMTHNISLPQIEPYSVVCVISETIVAAIKSSSLMIWEGDESKTVDLAGVVLHMFNPGNESIFIATTEGSWICHGDGSAESASIDLRTRRIVSSHRHYLLLDDRVVWDIRACEQICSVSEGSVALCVSPDDKYMGVGGFDGCVSLYACASGERLFVLPVKLPYPIACIDWCDTEDMIAFTGVCESEGESLPVLVFAAPEGLGDSFHDWSSQWTSNHSSVLDPKEVSEMKQRILFSVLAKKYITNA